MLEWEVHHQLSPSLRPFLCTCFCLCLYCGNTSHATSMLGATVVTSADIYHHQTFLELGEKHNRCRYQFCVFNALTSSVDFPVVSKDQPLVSTTCSIFAST